MNWEVYNDEVIAIKKWIPDYHQQRCKLARAKWQQAPSIHSRVVLISDGLTLEDFLLPALQLTEDVEVVFADVFAKENYSAVLLDRLNEADCKISLEELKEETSENTAYILLMDAQKCDPRWAELLKLCADKVRSNAKNKMVVGMLVPPVRPIPDGIEKLQEREYAFFLEKAVSEKTKEERFVVETEAALRRLMRELNQGELSYLRFDNIIGSTGAAFPAYDIKRMITKAFEDGFVTVTKEDHLKKISCIYARDAAICVLAGLTYGKHGHAYNVTRYSVTVAEIKESLQKLFPDRVALKTDGQVYSPADIQKCCLSSLKFFHEQAKLGGRMKLFGQALYSVVCAWMDIPYDVVSQLTCYEGKLNRLKSAEIDILKEIDRICRKHNIQYFLAGGSCLGAIRDNKSIPWDDDLDIGMLREDIEKFRKVAPQELGDKYVYSSPLYDENCHYYFDKVRLSDTYFSTFYSNKFVLDDGVFVDIVVYDQTSHRKGAQRRQITWVHRMTRFINLRWHGYPVGRGKIRKLARLILPIVNRIPFKWFHRWYDQAATRYAKLKNAEYVLDGGMHLRDGPFSKECISKVEYTTFDGMENAPIPAGYDEYLSFLYSPEYRPAPPLSSRLGAHKIARLDLGKYLFSDTPAETFRAVDIRGELFESEEER